MSPEERKLLEETLKLSRENHKLLRKMQSAARVGRIFRLIYWAIIIGSMFGFYYYFQPVIQEFIGAYQGLLGGIEKTQDVLGNLPGLGGILNGEVVE